MTTAAVARIPPGINTSTHFGDELVVTVVAQSTEYTEWSKNTFYLSVLIHRAPKKSAPLYFAP